MDDMTTALSALDEAWKGGPGSGFFGHAGRPGKVGGSAAGGSGKPAGATADDPHLTPRFVANRMYAEYVGGKEDHGEMLTPAQKVKVRTWIDTQLRKLAVDNVAAMTEAQSHSLIDLARTSGALGGSAAGGGSQPAGQITQVTGGLAKIAKRGLTAFGVRVGEAVPDYVKATPKAVQGTLSQVFRAAYEQHGGQDAAKTPALKIVSALMRRSVLFDMMPNGRDFDNPNFGRDYNGDLLYKLHQSAALAGARFASDRA